MALVDVKTKAVGPYVLDRTLGRGQTGLVKRGTHYKTGQHVAVKIVNKGMLAHKILQKVEREIAIMKLIEHPNVLHLYDVYENESHLFLVLEYVTGGELFDYLVKNGRLRESEARKFFRHLISAVHFCHSHCVCHRDLKPENLLLDSDYNVKVCDFGMASLQVEHQLLETSCGSPHYACPEIIRGQKYDGRKADAWSCGVILYALAVGSLPFDDRDGDLKTLLEKVKRGVFVMPSFLSTELQDLIAKMVKVNPKERLSIQDVMKHRWVTHGHHQLPVEMPVHEVVKTEVIPSHRHIDRDVLSSMRCLGSFKDAMELIDKLMSPFHNIEKVLYFLLLKRKADNPTVQDSEDYGLDDDEDYYDRPHKRLDACPAPQRRASVFGSPATFRQRNWTIEENEEDQRIRTVSNHTSPGRNGRRRLRKLSLQPEPFKPTSPSEVALTPPSQTSESRLKPMREEIEYDPPSQSEIVFPSPTAMRHVKHKLKKKKESPQFHRRKYNSSDSDTSSHGFPEDHGVKKSWFSNILRHDKEEIFMVVKDKEFHTLKADVVRALLALKVQHTLADANVFKLKYDKSKTASPTRIFARPVMFDLEICSPRTQGIPKSTTQTITMKLTKGSSRRFKHIVESIQERILLPPTSDELHQLPAAVPDRRKEGRSQRRKPRAAVSSGKLNGSTGSIKSDESGSFRGSPESSDVDEILDKMDGTPVCRRASVANPGH